MKPMHARKIFANFFPSTLKHLKAWWKTNMRRCKTTGILRVAARVRRRTQRPDEKRRELFFGEWTVWLLAFSAAFLITGVVGVELLPVSKQAEAYETLWRKATILGGVLTALAVLWRGLISSRQADKQAEQVARVAEQIELTRIQLTITQNQMAAADRERQIKLLQDGGELLESAEISKKSVGIITILLVSDADQEEFGLYGFRILIDFLERISELEWTKECDAISSGLREIVARRGRLLNKRLFIGNYDNKTGFKNCVYQRDAEETIYDIGIEDGIDKARCNIIFGVKEVIYEGCFFSTVDFEDAFALDGSHVFNNCVFRFCTFHKMETKNGRIYFKECIFIDCDFVREIRIVENFRPFIESSRFINCTINGIWYFSDRDPGNWAYGDQQQPDLSIARVPNFYKGEEAIIQYLNSIKSDRVRHAKRKRKLEKSLTNAELNHDEN